MYYFTRLSHIVDGFILPTGMRVWVVCTHTRTCLPDGYMMLPIYVSMGRNIISYPSPYRVKTCRVLRFRVPIAISVADETTNVPTPALHRVYWAKLCGGSFIRPIFKMCWFSIKPYIRFENT
jgi:hypothetical protein